MLDSLLYTLADELVPDAACATFATASEGDGVIVGKMCDEEKRDTEGGLGEGGILQRSNWAVEQFEIRAQRQKNIGNPVSRR